MKKILKYSAIIKALGMVFEYVVVQTKTLKDDIWLGKVKKSRPYKLVKSLLKFI